MRKAFVVILGLLALVGLSRGAMAAEHGGKEHGGKTHAQEHGGTPAVQQEASAPSNNDFLKSVSLRSSLPYAIIFSLPILFQKRNLVECHGF